MSLSFFKKLFSKNGPDIREVESVLGYHFNNRELLDNALAHRSSVANGRANERLEYLGDAVLGLVVSEFLFKRFPEHNEGDLTKMKAALVNETMLSKVAGNFELGQFIFLSQEEEKSGGRSKPSITADAVEAVIGAIYLDGGMEHAARVVKKLILNDFESLMRDDSMYNYKGELLEKMQAAGRGIPRYEVLEEIGPDHIKEFVISVSVDGVRLGTGRGTSKKEAEQKAARMALEALNGLDKTRDIN